MEYADLVSWLNKRRGVDAQAPIVINIELGDLFAKLINSRGQIRTRESYAPSPSD